MRVFSAQTAEECEDLVVDNRLGVDANDEVSMGELRDELDGQLVRVVRTEICHQAPDVLYVGEEVLAAVAEEEWELAGYRRHVVRRRLLLPVLPHVRVSPSEVKLRQYPVPVGCRRRK